MEELLPRLRQNLGFFCSRLESTCDALKISVGRRTIPLGSTLYLDFPPTLLISELRSSVEPLSSFPFSLRFTSVGSDSASTTFMESLNRRVTSLSCDLDLLESRSLGALSFQELLGHCDEVLKTNQSDIVELRDRLKVLGLEISGFDIDINEEGCLAGPDAQEDKATMPDQGSIMEKLQDDSLLEESMSLEKLGLSDACLASIASEGNNRIDGADFSLLVPLNHYQEKSLDDLDQNEKAEGDTDELKPDEPSRPLISVSKDDYETLPSYMKSLASWEDILIATEKVRVSMSKKKWKPDEAMFFHPDELESMGLGPKVRSYVLLLVRMKRIVVETKDGSISYRVV